MFFLSSISSDLEYWLVNHTSIYKFLNQMLWKSKRFLEGTSNNWLNDLSGTNVYTTLESCW